MFYGPGELIKKGRKFRARATVIELDGKTARLIHDVVEASELIYRERWNYIEWASRTRLKSSSTG
jgi:hypothetical protein